MNRQQGWGLAIKGALMALAAGCATTGYDRAGKMGNSMAETRQDVLDARSL